MHFLATTVPTFALSTIYCLYRKYLQHRLRRQRRLHERVAYMLWVAAMQSAPWALRHDCEESVGVDG
jgi:hypothetical protein